MTRREWHRQNLIWTIHLWMRRHGAWFVLVLSFSVASPEMLFAAETKSMDTLLTDVDLSAPGTAPKPAAVKRPRFELPTLSEEDEKAVGTMLDAKGTISARNKYGMAVEYGVDAKTGSSSEIWVNFHKKLKLSGMKDLSELGEGDRVRIQYKVTKETKRILLTEITLVSKKPKEKPPVLVAEESEASS